MISISQQAMRYLFDHDTLRGTELLVALAIFDFAGYKGDRLIAYPGHKTIARRARISERSVRRIITKLADAGYWQFSDGLGRGNVQGFELLKADAIMSAFRETKSGHPEHEKRSSGVNKSGQMATDTIKKNITEDSLKRELKHPAIEMVRSITGRFPPKPVEEMIIGVVGESPDHEFFKTCYANWLACGYNPTNFNGWLLEPARKGQIFSQGGKQKNGQPNKSYRQERADEARESFERTAAIRERVAAKDRQLQGTALSDSGRQFQLVESNADGHGESGTG